MPLDASIYGQIRQPEPLANQLLALAGAERQQVLLNAEQVALGQRRLDAVHQALAAQAANPNATADDLHRRLGDLVQQGLISPMDAQHYGAQVEALRGNPAGLRSYLNGHVNVLQDAKTTFNSTYGTPDVQDLGDNLLTRTVSPTMGVRNLGASPKTLTPQDKATRLPTFQGNQPGSVSLSETTDRTVCRSRLRCSPGRRAVAGGLQVR